MKLLLTLMIFSPLFLMAQKKFDNTVILPPVPLSEIKTILFKNNYTLVNSDTSLLTTTSKEATYASIATKFMIMRTDTATYFKGLYKTTGVWADGEEFLMIERRGLDFSLARKAWNEMVRIAGLLSPDLKYEKQ